MKNKFAMLDCTRTPTVIRIEEEHDLGLALRILHHLAQLVGVIWPKRAVVGELEALSKDSVDGVLELWERDWEQHHGNILG